MPTTETNASQAGKHHGPATPTVTHVAFSRGQDSMDCYPWAGIRLSDGTTLLTEDGRTWRAGAVVESPLDEGDGEGRWVSVEDVVVGASVGSMMGTGSHTEGER